MKTIKNILLCSMVLVSTILSAQTTTQNYIKTTTYQTKVQDGQQNQVSENDKIININYFDGLGRAKQSIAVKAAGQQTNILDWTKDWTVGTGSTPLYNSTGVIAHNQRLISTNPFGEQSMVWRCGNNINAATNGGWNTDEIPVDKNIAYRYTVWVKRTNSQTGNIHHGTWNADHVNGATTGNPYFFGKNLPQSDTWYLLVGIVYAYDYAGTNPVMSGIYDSNGNKVASGYDYKWKANTTTSKFRNFLYYPTATNAFADFWNPQLVKLQNNNPQTITQILQQSTPKDIVTHIEYDNYGRQTKQYLPFASEGTSGAYNTVNITNDINSYYLNKYQDDFPGITNPAQVNAYSEEVTEASPLHRVLEQGAPGSSWKADKNSDNDHTIKLDWQTNAVRDVYYFKVDFTDGNTEAPTLVKFGYYIQKELFVTITKDENWQPNQTHPKDHTTREYKDKLGRVVLKRTYNLNISHDTYYVYDDYGNLTYVIPPKVSLGPNDDVSYTELNELCYQYKYDHRNRVIEKKIPGKGWEYIVYNKLDQPIATQDANQKIKNEWLFTKYDVFGRVAYTGLLKYPGKLGASRATVQSLANQINEQFVSRTATAPPIANTDVYYTNQAFPLDRIDKIYTVNYYDDYDVGDIVGFHPSNTTGPWEGMNVIANPKGSQTVSSVRVLGTDQWVNSVYYYDEKGRQWETNINNQYLGTDDWILNKLDFVGKVLKSHTVHIKNGVTLSIVDDFTYDHMGRLLTQKQKINNQVQETIVHNAYDDLGQLESKQVGDRLQNVDYTYNIRGWLTGINDIDNIGNDLFTFKINYDKTEIQNAIPLFNGNISETQWQTASDGKKRGYHYDYDGLNRMKSANFVTYSDLFKIFSFSHYYTERVNSYDKNGNIKQLIRTSYGSDRYMDYLNYNYDDGNKLLSVTDLNNINEGFKDGNTVGNDYTYDPNGNMTSDQNKGITGIVYNHLNLPQSVTINTTADNGNISYIYDATGAKLKKIVTEGGSLTNTTEYAGNYIYKNGTLEFFSQPEGIVEPEADGYKYVYQYKDHLGNIRLSYKDFDKDGAITQDEIVQEKNYYPFGLQHKGYNSTISGREHNYGFGGKEEQNELGLEWLDFHARNYDPALGRWMNLDPLSDDLMQIDLTPYNYSWNNPTNISDPDGKCPHCLVGFFVGALVDYSIQVAVNFGKGETGLDAFTNNIDGTSILISGAAGALSGGLSTLKNVGTGAKAGISLAIDVAEESTQQLHKKGEVNIKDLVTNVVQGKVIDKSLGDINFMKNVSGNKIKTAERKLDRTKRVAGDNPRPSRQQAVIDAKSEVKRIKNKTVANTMDDAVVKKGTGAAVTSMRSGSTGSGKSKSKVKDERFQQVRTKDNTRVRRF